MKKHFVLRFNDGLYYRSHYSSETGNVAHKLEDASRYATHQEASRQVQRIKPIYGYALIVADARKL